MDYFKIIEKEVYEINHKIAFTEVSKPRKNHDFKLFINPICMRNSKKTIDIYYSKRKMSDERAKIRHSKCLRVSCTHWADDIIIAQIFFCVTEHLTDTLES